VKPSLAPIVAVIAGELCFAIMGAIIKHLAQELPNEVIVFFRNSLAFFIIVPLILAQSGIKGFATNQLRFHLLRGVIGVSAMSCFFYILGNMHFTKAILLKLTTPFFIPLIALLWLRERSSTNTLFAIGIGFVGVIFVVDPQQADRNDITLVCIGLLGAALAAVAKVTIRRMRDSEPSLRIVFYFSLVASALSAPFAINAWSPPTITQYGWLLALATVATIGQLLITAAYRRVSAGKIGQFTYTSLIFSSTMGWLIWDEAITLSILLGCVFIVGAGIINMKK
jgi:drug/metabolite transporter (DMT)-like permease